MLVCYLVCYGGDGGGNKRVLDMQTKDPVAQSCQSERASCVLTYLHEAKLYFVTLLLDAISTY